MNNNHEALNIAPSPCVMVIFGATGDLTKRKLIPALCNLANDNLLSKQFAIIGFAGQRSHHRVASAKRSPRRFPNTLQRKSI